MLPTALLADAAFQPARSHRREARRPRSVAAPATRRITPGRVALFAILALVVGGIAFLRVWPPLATVMSASMEPAIKTGDMVVLKRLDGAARPGDVVVISVPDEARARYGYPPVVIHRIVRVEAGGRVITKGDAKKEPDPFTVPHRALTTKVVATLPGGGRVMAFLTSGLGLLWLGAGGVLLLAMPLFDRQRDARRRAEAEAADLHRTLRTITEELTLLRIERVEAPSVAEQVERAVATALPGPPQPPVAVAARTPPEPAVVVIVELPAAPPSGPAPDVWPGQASHAAVPEPEPLPVAPPPRPIPPDPFVPRAPRATPDLLHVLRPRLVPASAMKRRPAPTIARWDTPPAALARGASALRGLLDARAPLRLAA